MFAIVDWEIMGMDIFQMVGIVSIFICGTLLVLQDTFVQRWGRKKFRRLMVIAVFLFSVCILLFLMWSLIMEVLFVKLR